MKKIILLILLISGQISALQVGLNQKRNLATPRERLQAKRANLDLKKTSEFPYAPRGLLIFLNDLEKECTAEAVGQAFTYALLQQPGPIIVSANLVRSVFASDRKMDLVGAISRFEGEKVSFDDTNPCTVLVSSDFDIQKWIIKEISSDLYLLLPHSYLERLNISSAQVNYWEKPEVNQIELILGFKVNHMRTIQVDDMIEKPLTRKHENAAYFVDALYKGDLFCTRADYQKSLIAQPLWTWFMVGHGYTGETIVDIPINDFKKLLDFASTRITMRLLAYLTCYGAGINTELLYNDEKTGIQKTYPFAIVTQAITDSQTWGYIHKEASSSREVMEEYTERPYDFDTFIKLSEKRDIDYEEILGCLFNIIPKKNFPGNIAQIKLPGIEWFSTVAGKQDVVSIGSVMSRTRTAPLNIQRFFTKKSAKANPARVDPKALLLETTYIPFEIIINGSSLEYIISMVPMPGMASIYIAALKSSVHDINKILDLIQRINGYDTKWLNKRFYISRITALNDKDQLTEYRDVVVFPNGYTYFKQGSNIYYKRMVDEKAIDENSEEGREVVSCLRDHYSEETFDAIKSEAYNYSKKLDVGTTEQTEGLSPENISKLEELFKKRSAAAAVGKLAASE